MLSFESKLRFIFSHSALKEGWDNPNVFQICTLKDAGNSDIRRRQEIGRGLRLAVNQQGERVYGSEVNTLTVMASETYKDFVENLQKEIEEDTGIRFGYIEKHSFANIVQAMDENKPIYLGDKKSVELFRYLVEQNYISENGKVQDSLKIALKNEDVNLPDEFTENKAIHNQILKNLKSAAGSLEIKNQVDKKLVKTNSSVLESAEFKALWDRVKYKTTFSVDFDSEKLIKECVTAINRQVLFSRGKLNYFKIGVNMTPGGIDFNEIEEETMPVDVGNSVLPDIVSYLQNETQLTRKSIVEILTRCDKLEHFKINPQKFIEACIDIINTQMSIHIVDGIKYEKIGDSVCYSQELFKNEELFGYLKSNLKESEKSPYEYVVYDSKVESNLVDSFERSSNVEVYAKLPDWFKIDTPLGTYNPDWAILWKNGEEEKLYFVVESKGTTDLDLGLRGKEKAKIFCGEKHFEAIGSKMIVASDMNDIEEKVI